MKKNILKISLALTVVAAAGYITYSSQTEELSMSSISLDNVEAIASGESGKVTCAGWFSKCIPGTDGPYVQYN